MEKIVITSGYEFTDIDVLSCAVAYTELLQLEGKKSESVISNKFTKSVTDEIQKWKTNYKNKPSENDCSFVLVDISNPKWVGDFVNKNQVIEIYDHHFGFEKYWKDKLDKNSHIEQVGSCATLIWEEFKKRGYSEKISKISANLLTASIISNTLNFKAGVTNKRDVQAFKELQPFTNLTPNWNSKYFQDQEKLLFKNPKKEIINDTHIEHFPDSDDKLIIGQMELWNGKKFIDNHKSDIRKALETFGTSDWFLTLPSISEGKNYIYSESSRVQNLLMDGLKVYFNKNLAQTSKLILRKEIKKILYKF